MTRVLLLQTQREYAETLAATVETHHPEITVEVVAGAPPRRRIRALASDADLVQVDELLINGVLGAAGSVIRGTPLVATARGWADYTNAHGQYGRLRYLTIRGRTRFVLRQVRELIFISRATERRFREHYGVGQSSVIGRPVDVETYDSGTETPGDTLDVLTVTNLRYAEKLRGVLTVLQALEPLFDRYPELRYRIAGGGRHEGELRRFLGEYEHADRVTFLGYVDGVADELASADAFVYVSFLDAYPSVVLEAQAAGLPVVGGHAVGVPEAVGDAGDVVPATPEGIGDALERLVTDDARRARLARQSREKMATYNRERTAEHVDVWQRVLNQ